MSGIVILQERMSELLAAKRLKERVDNPLHDTGVELAQLLLAERFPARSWTVATHNRKGIDVQGYLSGKLDVACEVTTHDSLDGNRRKQVQDDLTRLQSTGAQNKFLAIVHAEVLIQLRRMRAKALLEGVDVIDLPTQHFERLT